MAEALPCVVPCHTADPVAQVGFETEGTAIYDTMCYVNNEVHTVGVGAAMGQACMLLSAGHKGKRFMQPNATGKGLRAAVDQAQERLLAAPARHVPCLAVPALLDPACPAQCHM